METSELAEKAARNQIDAFRKALRHEPDIDAVVVTTYLGGNEARETSSFSLAGQRIDRPDLEVDFGYHPNWIDYFRESNASVGTTVRLAISARDDSCGFLVGRP